MASGTALLLRILLIHSLRRRSVPDFSKPEAAPGGTDRGGGGEYDETPDSERSSCNSAGSSLLGAIGRLLGWLAMPPDELSAPNFDSRGAGTSFGRGDAFDVDISSSPENKMYIILLKNIEYNYFN